MATRRKASVRGPSRLPWVLWFLTLAAGAGVIFYGLESRRLLEHELVETKDELKSMRTDVGRAERERLDLQSQLGRAQVDVKDNRQRFSQDAERADELKKKLVSFVGADRGDVRLVDDRIVLQVDDSALFKGPTSELSDEGKEALRGIGDMLIDMRERDVLVEGHTTDKPVREAAKGFDTNWEYAAARATAIVEYLHANVGVAPERLGVVSFSEFRPISRTKRAKNLRIDIVLAPRSLQRIED